MKILTNSKFTVFFPVFDLWLVKWKQTLYINHFTLRLTVNIYLVGKYISLSPISAPPLHELGDKNDWWEFDIDQFTFERPDSVHNHSSDSLWVVGPHFLPPKSKATSKPRFCYLDFLGCIRSNMCMKCKGERWLLLLEFAHDSDRVEPHCQDHDRNTKGKMEDNYPHAQEKRGLSELSYLRE